MVIAFDAKSVAIDDMDDLCLVGFADEAFDTQQYLILQRSYVDDEQDVRLGMNTYHVERDDQRWSCYGGIERFELHKDRVVVRFTPSDAQMLQADGMEITFAIDGTLFEKLTRRLERIFVGSNCLAVKV